MELAVENRKKTSTNASFTEVSPIKDSGKLAPCQDNVLMMQWQEGGVTDDSS
jgi:hypothetical protein